MTKYIVHLYREMRLCYTDIEAGTPEAAAEIVRGKATDDADNVEDCEGQNLAALVDVAGDEDYSESVTIDFEAERQRKAAAKLLASLEAILPYAENEAYSLEKLKDSPEAEAEADRAWKSIEQACAVIAAAKAAGITPAPACRLSMKELHDTTHTPGPWRVFDVLTDPEIVTDRPTAHLTQSIVRFNGQANARANATLMAAAPAQAIILSLVQLGLMTLAAGEVEFDGVMYWLDERQADWCVGVVNAIGWDTARDAIAKASAA